MPKMKTNKSVAKRIKTTKNGKLRRLHPGHSHLLSHKSPNQRRKLRKPGFVCKTQVKSYKQVLPH